MHEDARRLVGQQVFDCVQTMYVRRRHLNIYTLIEWTVSLADFQLQPLLAFFIDNWGFTDGKIIESKFMPELWFVNSLRDSASFSRFKYFVRDPGNEVGCLKRKIKANIYNCNRVFVYGWRKQTPCDRLEYFSRFPPMNKVDTQYLHNLSFAGSGTILWIRFQTTFDRDLLSESTNAIET